MYIKYTHVNMEIIGGIEALAGSEVETIVSGGNRIVVGNNAVDAMRDRAIYLKDDLKNYSVGKLLGIIGMSQPIAFGVIAYDDGETSFIVSNKKSRTTPDVELMKELTMRLHADPVKIAEWLVEHLNLNQPLWLAMGDFIDQMIRRIDECLITKGKRSLGILTIGTPLGCLIPFTTSGKLEVSSNPEVPAKTFKALAEYLLDLAVSKKCVSGNLLPMSESGEIPRRPEVDSAVITSMNNVLEQQHLDDQNEVREFVGAIIMRENHLTPFLAAVEGYNVKVAQEIQTRTSRILEYFGPTARV